MKRDINYRVKSFKELLELYAFEVNRINEKDRLITQNKIANEIYARISDTFMFLDSEPQNAHKIYKQFLKG